MKDRQTDERLLDEVKKKIHPASTRQNLLIVLMTVTVVIPAIDLWRVPGSRIFEFISGFSVTSLVVIACVGGVIALVFWYPDPGYRLIGIIPGILIGLGVFGALFLYFSFRRNVFLAELIVPICLGIAPGVLIYNQLVKRKALAEIRAKRRW